MFVDDDFLWLGDMKELIDQIDDKYAIMCVQHDYKPTVEVVAGKRKNRIRGRTGRRWFCTTVDTRRTKA